MSGVSRSSKEHAVQGINHLEEDQPPERSQVPRCLRQGHQPIHHHIILSTGGPASQTVKLGPNAGVCGIPLYERCG